VGKTVQVDAELLKRLAADLRELERAQKETDEHQREWEQTIEDLFNGVSHGG
jgi:hypothetical protein